MYISRITNAHLTNICDLHQAVQRYTINHSSLHTSKCDAVTQGLSKCAQ